MSRRRLAAELDAALEDLHRVSSVLAERLAAMRLASSAWPSSGSGDTTGRGRIVHWWRGEPTDEAKAICRGCLVRDECNTFAAGDFAAYSYGIWGGLSARERREGRRSRRQAA